MTTRAENLGPADRILQALLGSSEHLVHNRTGIVAADARFATGVRWSPATCREENGVATVYGPRVKGQKTGPVLGTRQADGRVLGTAGALLGAWQPAGLFEPAATWMYRQVAEVYKLDPEFVARWASWSFGKEHRDLKVVLAAFLLVQPRSGRPLLGPGGAPLRDNDGKLIYAEEDDREVGEAMLLLRRTDKLDLSPKLVLRVGELLRLPAIAALNRELGFGGGTRRAFLGRYPAAVEAWLRARERNPSALTSLVKAGYRRTVMALARSVRYKPESDRFFVTLRWKQAQHEDGRRAIGIGMAIEAGEDWSAMDEAQVCIAITAAKPSYKRLLGLVPASVGITPAVMAAAIEAGSLSDADLVIATPTLEDLGLLRVEPIRAKWEAAIRAAENQRARNVAKNVRDESVKANLEAAADAAAAKIAAAATRGLRIYACIDISGSMSQSIAEAKSILARLLVGIPAERVHVAVFNTTARELRLPPGASGTATVAKAVLDALFGPISAGGGTDYACPVRLLAATHVPADDEDVIILYVGDEAHNTGAVRVTDTLRGVKNLAGLALVKVPGEPGRVVHECAATLSLPLAVVTPASIPIDDPYAVPRVLRALLASAPPVATTAKAAPPRRALVEEILATERLRRPVYCSR